jgi:hypothetical protein
VKRPRGSSRKLFWCLLALAAILLFAAAPIISALTAGAIANAHGCTLHEGFVNPCVINGTDYGETLYQFGVMGWFMLFTIPTGLFLLFIWLAVATTYLYRWYQARP